MFVGKVVCIGRNYFDYIDEMNLVVFIFLLLFLKLKVVLCSMYVFLVVFID